MGELMDTWHSLFGVKKMAAAERVCPDHWPQIGTLAPTHRLDENGGQVNGIGGGGQTSKAGANTSMPQWDKALSALPSTTSWNSPASDSSFQEQTASKLRKLTFSNKFKLVEMLCRTKNREGELALQRLGDD